MSCFRVLEEESEPFLGLRCSRPELSVCQMPQEEMYCRYTIDYGVSGYLVSISFDALEEN